MGSVASVVVMSVYNAKPQYLHEQIDSILNQSVAIDIIIRDDGSTDAESIAALEAYRDNPRILIHFGQNVGFVRSFFEVLSMAGDQYDYYFLSDQDDYWEPNRVDRAIAVIERASLNYEGKPLLCWSGFSFCDERLSPIEHQQTKFEPSFRNAVSEIPIPGMSMVINARLRELALRAKCYDMPGHDWWFYLIATAFGGVVKDPCVSLRYRRHDANVSNYSGSFFEELKWKFQAFVIENQLKTLQSMICEFKSCFGDEQFIYTEDEELLSLITSNTIKGRLKLVFYPRRFRSTLAGEFGYRALILIGRL